MKKLEIQDVLAMLLIAGYIIDTVTSGPENQTYRDIIILIIGYYFGSSLGSKKKTDILQK